MVRGHYQRQSGASTFSTPQPQQPQEAAASGGGSSLQRAPSTTSLSSLTSSSNTAPAAAATASKAAVPDTLQQPLQPQNEESAAHTAFIESFAAPTHLYRYLALRRRHSPVFLNRCLAYLRRGHSRARSLADTVALLESGRPVEPLAAQSVSAVIGSVTGGVADTDPGASTPWDLPRNATLELTFSGFFDSCREKEWVTVSADLDLSVVNRCHNRRKSTRTSGHRELARLPLDCNPHSRSQRSQSQQQLQATKTSNSSFSVMNKELRDSQANRIVQSFLLFRISATEKRSYSKMYDSPPDSRKSHKKDMTEYPVQYCAVLPLFNHSRVPPCADSGSAVCSPLQLCSGDYECRLECLGAEQPPDLADASSRLHQEWHATRFRQNSSEVAEYDKWPVIRFRAQWTGVTGEMPPAAAGGGGDLSLQQQQSLQNSSKKLVQQQQQQKKDPQQSSGNCRVSYGFFHAGRCHQWSEVASLRCPWCDLDCRHSNGLLCHLRACHPRLQFSIGAGSESQTASSKRHQHLHQQQQSLCIEVRVNLDYNGGFEGDPANVFRPSRYDAATYPSRRLSFTHLVHWRGTHCPPESQQEFLATNPKPLVSGHTRQYFHTQTCVPLMPEEIDIDSEDEVAPDWLKQKYTRNLEDFTDVNAGEKAVMEAWNLHAMTWECGPVTGQHQLPQLCQSFIDRCGRDLLARKLRGNVLLHLVNLTDYGLIKPDLCFALIQQLDGLPMVAKATTAKDEPMQLG